MSTEAYQFNNLLGQEKAKALLLRAYTTGKISHAYLFSGPPGTGKKRTAHTLAALLFCPHSDQHDADACGQCPACRKMAAASHPDFVSISAQGGTIKISQIRALKQQLHYPPLEAPWRVILLADIQDLGLEAANSLLKTLEEPPANTVLILTVNSGDTILSTIQSRCQRVPFFPLPFALVSQVLCQEEAVSADQAATLAAIAEGSLGRARQLAQSPLLPLRKELVGDFCQRRKTDPESVAVMLRKAEQCAALGEELPELLDLLALWLRDHLLLLHNISTHLRNYDLLPILTACQKGWQAKDLLHRLEHIRQARRQLASNCGRALVCEVLFFNLL